jgi:RHS repeat-associated protein
MKPLTSESSHLSATGGVAGNTRPRVSGSTHPAGRRSRPGRMARCRRSSVAASTTWAPVRVGCSVFLNNRYYDPTVGVFISVDPLVEKTGTPYLYAAGNPTTLSDPSGLDPGWAHDNDPCRGW